MHVIVKALALAGACGMAVAAGPARADVIYTWDGSPSFSFGSTTLVPRVVLDITDAAVQRGSFNLSGTGVSGPTNPLPFYTGDLANFVSFSATGLSTATPTSFPSFNSFNVTFLFDTVGDITSDGVAWFGAGADGQIGGNEALSTGTLSSDLPSCGGGGAGGLCGTISGSWTHTPFTPVNPVPEPASLALLGAGVLGLALARRRAA